LLPWFLGSFSQLLRAALACALADCLLHPSKLKPSPSAQRPLRSTRALRMGPVLRRKRMTRRRVTTRDG